MSEAQTWTSRMAAALSAIIYASFHKPISRYKAVNGMEGLFIPLIIVVYCNKRLTKSNC